MLIGNRAVATAAVVLLALALPGCRLSRHCDAETAIVVEPVRGSSLKDMRLEARLTSEGKPVPGEDVHFVLYTSPDRDHESRDSYTVRTDENGVAIKDMAFTPDNPDRRQSLSEIRSVKAVFDAKFGPLCDSTDRAPFEYRP